MRALIFDTETTGLLNPKLPADHISQPRMASLAAALVGGDGTIVDFFHYLVQPEGWPMNDEAWMANLVSALNVNGLTPGRLLREGLPLPFILDHFDALVDQCELIAAYGIWFDQKIIRGEQRRLGRSDRYGQRPTFCIQQACVKLCNLPPSEKMSRAGRHYPKTPKLTEAVSVLLGEEHPGAHNAEHDLRKTAEIYALLHARGLVVAKEQVSKGDYPSVKGETDAHAKKVPW